MRALHLVEIGNPLIGTDLEMPTLGPGDLRVRVEAAGICHSDVHYRAGTSYAGPLPLVPGHEVAGTVDAVGEGVSGHQPGERVCLHYLVTCGDCRYCRADNEPFCPDGQMLGKHRNGGFAEFIVVPARNAFLLPDSVSMVAGAVMMCSASTSYHALRRARMQPGESVAVFGIGGLGLAAVQLALAMGASQVFAVDLQAEKLALAAELGAVPVAGGEGSVATIREACGGVDVALELVGHPDTMRQAVQVLGVQGRAALAGITERDMTLNSYADLIGREAEVMGVSDHLAVEIPDLLAFAAEGRLDVERGVTETVPLEAGAVNRVLDELAAGRAGIRSVIVT